MQYCLAYVLVWCLSKLFFPLTIHGDRSTVKRGTFIVASNHISNIDPPLLGFCLLTKMSYWAKDTLFKNKILGALIRGQGGFPINRESADIGALREALRRVKSGSSMVVFPEGTRKRGAGESSVHEGVGFLVAKSGVPVVPVFIRGTDKVLPPNVRFPRRHPVEVFIGRPVTFPPQKDYEAVARQIMREVEALAPSAV
ncbi:MAG: lysophospholipid acyltransferase family protein [Candidatus Omnitrophota bacterium]|nr:lysophospholipid acyltransferase family protein [Candidatus Omnitrophota bacterium]MDZ4242427.1 lysophospholipid acyltransferase family protein [Candidatus Omnitrophota bacterium]